MLRCTIDKPAALVPMVPLSFIHHR